MPCIHTIIAPPRWERSASISHSVKIVISPLRLLYIFVHVGWWNMCTTQHCFSFSPKTKQSV